MYLGNYAEQKQRQYKDTHWKKSSVYIVFVLYVYVLYFLFFKISMYLGNCAEQKQR